MTRQEKVASALKAGKRLTTKQLKAAPYNAPNPSSIIWKLRDEGLAIKTERHPKTRMATYSLGKSPKSAHRTPKRA